MVGQDRMPTFEDLPTLPHTAASDEVLRWRTVSPGEIPHPVLESDEYMGYRTRKVAMVVANHWSVEFDDQIFEHPYDFKPERWL
ncbi:cytochrome P450 [Aspergillus pseudonomiae]|nr:cytochrome P450 [Aspergillus pseudonomiae]